MASSSSTATIVVELAPGMGQEAVEQLVGGHLKIGAAQRVEAIFQPEVAARPVACLEQAVGVETSRSPALTENVDGRMSGCRPSGVA